MPKHLTAEQVDHFHTQGYAFPFRAFDAERAADYRSRIEAYEAAVGHDANRTLKIKGHLAFPWLVDIARTPAILDAVEDLIGPDILLFGASIFAKEVANLLAALTTAQKQRPMQAMVVTGFIAAGNLLLNRDPHDFSIGNFELAHTLSLSEIRRLKCKSIMQHYLCRHVYNCISKFLKEQLST